MRGSNFFKKNEEVIVNKESETTIINEMEKNTTTTNTMHNNEKSTITNKTINRPTFKEFEVLDTEVIKYIIERFPESAVEIKSALINLYNKLENTIDDIEDESSSIIKLKRDFKLSEEYRSKSIKIYNIGQDVIGYVNWMNDTQNNKLCKTNDTNEVLDWGKIKESEVISIDNIEKFKNSKKIFEDFTLIEPKAFRLANHIVEVEDWDDLLVKTAEVLTKNYKKNRLSDEPINEDIDIVTKRSQQNTLRDTVIEMLNEYKISLKDYEIKH